jgi:opacity protein-like surface antigen
MRKIFVSLAVLAAAGAAQSADLGYDYDSDYLRGSDYGAPPPPPVIDWSGVYVGGHGGYSAVDFAKRQSVESFRTNFPGTATYTIANAPGTDSRTNGGSFGAYAGYNMQVDDVVLGLEADYTHSNTQSLAKGYVGTAFLADPTQTTRLIGTTRTSINDYGTIRARAGYAIGNVLPYVTGGLAFAQATFANTLYLETDPTSAFQQRSQTKTILGATAGAGIEYAITPNVLLRGEYQFVNFETSNGQSTRINTIRGGAAVKF